MTVLHPINCFVHVMVYVIYEYLFNHFRTVSCPGALIATVSSQIGAYPAACNRGRRTVRALGQLQLWKPHSETQWMCGEDMPSPWWLCSYFQGQHGPCSRLCDVSQHSGGPTIRPSSVAYRASAQPSALPDHVQLNGIYRFAKARNLCYAVLFKLWSCPLLFVVVSWMLICLILLTGQVGLLMGRLEVVNQCDWTMKGPH